MIHNSSTDPVLIKKISLKIWSLRDEIESRLQDKIENGASLSESDILKIRTDYTKKEFIPDNVLNLKSVNNLDTGEDEMAKAMASMGQEENSDENSDKNLDEENQTENSKGDPEAPASQEAVDPNIISISLDAPSIAVEKIAKGKTVLSEISMEKMFFFCNKPFTEGQSIVIQFCIPKSFIVNADILYCRPFNLKSRIISQNNYTHRALIRFNFLKEGERALLRQFLKSVEPEFVKVEKKADAESDSSEGTDFNELDDLGL
jgi:hypothetical protein